MSQLKMDRQEVYEAVQKVVAERLSMETWEIESHHKLSNDLGIDSMHYLDIVTSLESHFHITPANRSTKRSAIAVFTTVEQLCTHVTQHLRAKGRFMETKRIEPVLA